MNAIKRLLDSFEIDIDSVNKSIGWMYYGDIDPKDALEELAELQADNARLRLVEQERDALKKVMWKIYVEEPCDNDGQDCICVSMVVDYFDTPAALKGETK